MYQVRSNYQIYYKDYINRDVREFKLECKITGKTIDESQIASINIDYDLLSGSEEYTIGNLAAAKLTMVISSNVQVFETNEVNLTVKLKARDDTNNTIWIPIPLGRFYIFEVSSTNLSRTITAYDDLYKTELERTYNSKLTYPTTVHKVLDEICPLLGITYDPDISDRRISRPEVVTETVLNNGKYEVVISESNQVCLGAKVGQALMYIASFLNGNFMVDGDNCLKLIKYPKKVTKSLDSTKYATPTIGIASYNMNKIDCTTYPGNVISVGYSENSSSMTLENPFLDRAMLLTMLDELNDITYHQAKVRLKGDPTLQLGDLVEINHVGSDGNILSREQIPILRMMFSYTGGCTNEIEAPCKAITEKTINYKGTISSRVDGLETSLSSLQSATQEIYESIKALKTVKDNVDDMNTFIEHNSTLTNNLLNQFDSILEKIKKSDTLFKGEYDEIYNNKYL
jgi:hypothetical protein